MDSTQTVSKAREAALATLAVVGFVAIIGGGMWLAVYSTRYVPEIVNRVGSAAVYLGSFFTPAPAPSGLAVVPTDTASTTLPFEHPATSTPPVATTTPIKPPPHQVPPPTPATTPGQESTGTYPIGTTAPGTGTLFGYPDLMVTINAIGYLTSTSTDSFVTASTVPNGFRPAVKFTIKNAGTNTMAPWRFSASIPTQSSYIFQSPTQQQLAPGESIDYVLGFDQATRGSGQMVSVTANPDHTVIESNTNNNSASAYLTILGS